MVERDFKSLLGKSSGMNFGDLAAAYMSGSGKKSNRSRNILLGSLFFNARESVMNSRVMKNLRKLDASEAISLAKSKADYTRQFDLQTKNDSIISEGVSKYYNSEADVAFTDYVKGKGMGARFDGSNESANVMKKQWKDNWSEEQYSNFKDVYNPSNAKRLNTYEEYSAPILNKFQADEDKITNPQNLSLVHQVLGFAGIGDKRNKKLEEEYVKYDKEVEELDRQAVGYSKVVSRANTSKIPMLNFKTIKISNDQFDEEAARFSIEPTSAIYKVSFREFQNNIASDRTLGKAEEIFTNNILNSHLVEKGEQIKNVRKNFEIGKANGMYKNMDEVEIEALVSKNIRDALGLTDRTQDAKDMGNFLANLQIAAEDKEFETPEARKKYVNDVMKKHNESLIAKGLGVFSPAKIAQMGMVQSMSDLATRMTIMNPDTSAAINATPLSDNAMRVVKDSDLDLYNYIIDLNKTGGVTDSENTLEIQNGPYAVPIRKLQENEFQQNTNRQAKRFFDLIDYDDAVKFAAGYSDLSNAQIGDRNNNSSRNNTKVPEVPEVPDVIDGKKVVRRGLFTQPVYADTED